MWAQQLKKTCQGKECQSLYYTSKPQFSTTRSSSALDTTDERSAARSVGGNRCLLLAGFWIAFLLLKCPFIPVFQEHPAQFSESTLCHTEEPIPLFFISKRSTAHNDPQWSGGAADQTWRPRKVAAVIQMPSRLIFFSFLSFFLFLSDRSSGTKGNFTSSHRFVQISFQALKTHPLTHWSDSEPVTFCSPGRSDILIHLASPQKFERWTSSTSASAIVHAEGRGNKSVGPRFHLFQLFGLLRPISAIVSLFLSWESDRCLWNNPPPHHHHHTNTWPVAKGWGRLVGRPIMLS